MTVILPLSSQTENAIEALLDAAFGPDRHGRTAYAIRRRMEWLPDLSYALIDSDGTLSGLLQSWPVALHTGIDDEPTPLVMVGPVAVLPERQGAGHGRALMDRLIADVDANPATPPLVMIGDPEYYGRFWGFDAERTEGWRVPGPVEQRRLLARAPKKAELPRAGSLGPRLFD